MRPEDEPVTYTSIDNPQWIDESREAVICRVKFDHEPEPADFVCRVHDVMPYSAEIFNRCISGEFGELSVAHPARLDGLPRGEPGARYYMGDFVHTGPNERLKEYLNIANRENRSGSEAGTVIAWTNILEEILARALRSSKLSPITAFYDKIEKSFELRLIDEEQRGLLHLVRQIRNELSHKASATLDQCPAKGWCQKLYRDAIGDDATPSLRLQFVAACGELLANLVPLLPHETVKADFLQP